MQDLKVIVAWMQEIAAATIPYLAPDELGPFRFADRINYCTTQSPAIAQFSQMIDAVIDRDVRLMAIRADALLQSGIEDFSPVVVDYVLRVSMLGHLAGESDLRMPLTWDSEIAAPEARTLERRYLRSLANDLPR